MDSRTSPPTTACASRNGIPASDEELGEVGRAEHRVVGGGRHPVGSKVAASIIPVERAEREDGLVDRVEQWLLVLLQVTVVRERQALQRREEPAT